MPAPQPKFKRTKVIRETASIINKGKVAEVIQILSDDELAVTASVTVGAYQYTASNLTRHNPSRNAVDDPLFSDEHGTSAE